MWPHEGQWWQCWLAEDRALATTYHSQTGVHCFSTGSLGKHRSATWIHHCIPCEYSPPSFLVSSWSPLPAPVSLLNICWCLPHIMKLCFFFFFFTCSLPTGVESCGAKLWSNALERIRVQVTETWINSQVFHPPPWLKQRKGRQLSWKAKAKALLKPRVELQVLISKTYSTLWESSVGTLMGEARNSQRREGGKRPGLAEPTGFWWMDAASTSFLYIF